MAALAGSSSVRISIALIVYQKASNMSVSDVIISVVFGSMCQLQPRKSVEKDESLFMGSKLSNNFILNHNILVETTD